MWKLLGFMRAVNGFWHGEWERFPALDCPNHTQREMKGITDNNFGVIIAFLLPGFLLLWGLSFTFTQVSVWLARSGGDDAPTIGGFLYATLASLGLGLLISAVRWLVIDHLHNFTGVHCPDMNFANLRDKGRFAAFHGVIENHYRYYQYYANTLVAIATAFVAYIFLGPAKVPLAVWLVTIAILVALFLGSRDALRKYYDRATVILANTSRGESDDKRLWQGKKESQQKGGQEKETRKEEIGQEDK